MKVRVTKIVGALLWIGLGLLLGGFLFSGVQPRSLLVVHRCEQTCFNLNQVTGLMAAAALIHTPALIPSVVLETDKTVVVKHPVPEAPIHYVILPKKDIKDAGQIAEEDIEYLSDAYAVMQELIRKDNLQKYRIFTNGPGYQHVGYLHFHLRGK